MSDKTLLLFGLVAITGGFLLAIGTVISVTEERRRVKRSLDAIAATQITGMPVLDVPDVSFMDRVIVPTYARMTRLGRTLSPSGYGARLQRRLDLAGNPGEWTADRTLAAKALVLVIGVLLGFVLGHGPMKVLFALAGGALGFYAPDLYLYNAGTKRQEQIRISIADSIDLLTISVEAGLGFDGALAQVARNTEGPLAGELFRVLQEMQIGRSRSEALRSLADRTNVPELKAFVSSMVQADQFGIPIANVLREQSKEMRVKRRQRAEEKAQKVPVKIMVPLVLFIFPSIFVATIGPGAIKIVQNFPRVH